MEPIKRFEDLDCWKSSRLLVKMVYELSQTERLSHDWDTKSQLKRATLSIMNNIAEGFGRYGDKDSLRFYDIAKASAYEVKSMLYVLEDVNYLNEEQLKNVRALTDSTLRLTLGWIKYLNKSANKINDKDILNTTFNPPKH
jgi:four helix bundle protein